MEKEREYLKEVNRVSVVTLTGNALLSALKLVVGIIAFSVALISDAIHSLSDCFSTVVLLIGVHAASKKTDRDHPYGHERLECIAALVLSAMLLATALVVGYNGVLLIIDIVKGATHAQGSLLALSIALVSVGVKGWMYFYTERKAKKYHSNTLHADAVHHLSDSLSSVAAAVGIFGSMMGVPVLDPIASILIAVLIVKAAWDICLMAVNQLVDKAASEETEQKIAEEVCAVKGVERIDVLRTRQYSNKIFVDLEIAVNADLSLLEAHKIAESVHERVEHNLDLNVKHCMVHVNPHTESDNHEDPTTEMEE